MRNPFRRPKTPALDRMFETRSDAWAAVGLGFEVNRAVVRRATRRLIVEIPLVIGVIVGKVLAVHGATAHRVGHTGTNPTSTRVTAVTAGAVLLVLALGWLISRDLGRAAPALFRRMDPGTAGTVEFMIRLISVAATVLAALAVSGVAGTVLAVGGAFTAVVVGLAAQQTLGNLFAGMVLLSARPFRLGERVRLQAGALAGGADGVVASLGLLYTTLSRGEERIMIPNNLVLSSAILPLSEPESVDVKVTLGSGVRPTHVQAILDANVATPTRKPPSVLLEEISGDSVVVRVQATPERHSDGARLADEIIAALVSVTGEHATVDVGAPRS